MSKRTTVPSSTPVATDPDPMKTRIITHMNADHARSLALFQRHYNHIPERHAATAQLADITTEHMVLTSSFGRTMVPFDPPMASLGAARARLVTMHQECLAALDLSDIVVKEWVPPTRRALHTFNFVLCAFIFFSFSSRSSFSPSSTSPLYNFWSAYGFFPQLASFCWAIQPYLLTFMIVVHGGEAGWLAKTRLRKHGVKISSPLWWVWTVDCFIEGFGCFHRFDELVRGLEKKKKKESEKH